MQCRNIGLGLVFVFLFSCATEMPVKTIQNELPAAIERVRPAVVQIAMFASGFEKGTEQATAGLSSINVALGSGFLVNDGYAITALHVVAAGEKELKKIRASRKSMWLKLAFPNYVGKHIASQGVFQAVDFDIVDKDPGNDLALLKLRETLDQIQGTQFIESDIEKVPSLSVRAGALNLKDLQDGLPIGVSGYPLNQPVLITTSGHLAARRLNVIQNGLPIPTISYYYLADIHVNSGNSGGPAYLIPDGSIIGMCVAYEGDYVRGPDGKPTPFSFNSGLARIIAAKHVANILKRNNVKFSESSGRE